MAQRRSRPLFPGFKSARVLSLVLLAWGALCVTEGADAGTGAAESFSGYPVPRFVSLGADKVNVRAGPSKLHPIKWQYVRLGLPVKVIAETQEWRQIRDAQGNIGWVFHALLDGRRTVLVTGDGTGRPVALREQADPAALIVAVAEPGALLRLEECSNDWCRVTAPEAQGWVHRSLIWGVLATEGWD